MDEGKDPRGRSFDSQDNLGSQGRQEMSSDFRRGGGRWLERNEKKKEKKKRGGASRKVGPPRKARCFLERVPSHRSRQTCAFHRARLHAFSPGALPFESLSQGAPPTQVVPERFISRSLLFHPPLHLHPSTWALKDLA